jgi:hypothetical protein
MIERLSKPVVPSAWMVLKSLEICEPSSLRQQNLSATPDNSAAVLTGRSLQQFASINCLQKGCKLSGRCRMICSYLARNKRPDARGVTTLRARHRPKPSCSPK